MNSCETCFHTSKLIREEPCNSCVYQEKWVAMDFLKDIPDNTPEENEAFEVIANMAEQLIRGTPFTASTLALTEKQFLKMQKPQSSALDKQVSGGHYKGMKIQPIEFIHANNIPFPEGNAIKYLCRWRDKGGIKDLEKAMHVIELLIELEGKK